MSHPIPSALARVTSPRGQPGWLTSLATGRRSLRASLTALAFTLGTAVCPAAPSTVEVQPSAEAAVDRALTGRLVQLEISDVQVPAPPGARTTSTANVVFVRVYAKGADLTIELWERGELQGTRHLSLKGSSSLLSRRVALAAGEMAERLRDQRHAAWRAHRRQQARLARQHEAMPLTLRAAPHLAAQVVSAWVPEGSGFGVGPRLSAGLRGANGSEFTLGATALSLRLDQPNLKSWLQWYELSAQPGYSLRFGSASSLKLGFDAAVAVVHVANGRLDTEGGLRVAETWSGRAGVDVLWRWRWRPHVELSAGLEAGAIVRRVRILDDAGRSEPFGGAWFGAALGIGFL